MCRRNGMMFLLVFGVVTAGTSLVGCADNHHGNGYGYDRGAYWNGDDQGRYDRDWRDDRRDSNRHDNGNDHDNDNDHHGWWWWNH
jgi:hypothetical protein